MGTVCVREAEDADEVAALEDIGGAGERTVLEVNSRALLVGSRTRVLSLAQDLQGHSLDRIVVARCIAPGRSISHLSWCPARSTVVQVAQCFGAVTLRHVRQGAYPTRVPRVRIGDGVPLVLAVQNRGGPTPVTVVLLAERHLGPDPLYSVD